MTAPALRYPPDAHGPSPRRRAGRRARPLLSGPAGRALLVLALINLLNYLDRFVVSALAESLKRSELALTDTQLGLLMTGFVVVYMLASPVFGALGDRGARPRLVALRRLHLEPGHRAGRLRRQLHGPLPGPRRGRHRRGGLRHHRPEPAGRPLPEDPARPGHGHLLRRHPHRLGARLRPRRPGRPRLGLAGRLLHRRRARAAAGAPLPAARRPAARRARTRPAGRRRRPARLATYRDLPPQPQLPAHRPRLRRLHLRRRRDGLLDARLPGAGARACRRPRRPSSSAPSWW